MEERLRKFAHLVDAGNFTRASKELHISQPALSVAISKLERELGAELLVRSGHSLRLTEAGQLAYVAAKDLDTVAGNLSAEIAELTRRHPAVTIGMIDSIAGMLFSSAANVSELDRRAEVSIVVNNSRYLLDATIRGQIDVAFVVEQPGRQTSAFEETYIASELLVVVCHNADADAVRASVRQGCLPRFISYDQGSTTRRLVDGALEQRGVVSEASFFSTSPEVMLRLVMLRKGVAALPYFLVKDLLTESKLSLVSDSEPILIERRISVVKRRGKHLVAPLEYTLQQVYRLLSEHNNIRSFTSTEAFPKGVRQGATN